MLSEGLSTDVGLVWNGKNDVERKALPLRVSERVTGPRVQQYRLPLVAWPDNYPRDWKNKLILGDNRYVMTSLLEDFAGEIDLIYVDPPFATGAEFTVPVRVGKERASAGDKVLSKTAYSDNWSQGLSSYLQMIYEQLNLMRQLLSDTGTLYIHLDWHTGHYVKVVADEIFGRDNFRNEIIWHYDIGSGPRRDFKRKHDMILRYSKSERYVFNLDPASSLLESSVKPSWVGF